MIFPGQHFCESWPVIGAEAAYLKLPQLLVEPPDRVVAAVSPAPGQHLVRLGCIGIEEPAFAPLPLPDKRPHLIYLHYGIAFEAGSELAVVRLLVKVTKKRQDTLKQVDVDVIQQSNKITTNILSVSFLQTEVATDSIQPRTIRAAIFSNDGELLSDQFSYNFDIEEGSERQREVKHRFQLSSKASGKYKNQTVKLVLEEPVEGSSKWKLYKEYMYTLNISFSNDFDDF